LIIDSTSSTSQTQGVAVERSLLAEHLRARAPEIRQAILDRLHGMEEQAPTRDGEYLRGLHEAVHCGVEYGISLLAGEKGRDPHVPIGLVTQARQAARQAIPLEIVIRRYLAAKTLLEGFVVEEAATITHLNDPIVLRDALSTHATEFDRLLSLVIDEYGRENQGRCCSLEAQLLIRIRRLLAGELVDSSSFNYNLRLHHLGVIIASEDGRHLIRELAAETNSRPLVAGSADNEVWGWLGSKEPLDPDDVRRLADSVCSASIPLGIGEPAQAIAGWRLTHRQARAAFTIAQRSPRGFARYADVSILASAAQDPLMLSSFRALYLVPLSKERDSGELLRKTLRAYFSTNRNSQSAAAALGVTRQTVANRLRQVEDRLGQKLDVCAGALDAALRLDELGLLD
jgi:PucR C-terminal helix-turn-helix domain/GGDEF-like domain